MPYVDAVGTLGLRFVIDTNLLTDDSAEMEELRELHRAGWIELNRTNAMDIDLSRAIGEKRPRLQTAASEYVEHLGVWVLGQSRVGVDTMLGSEADANRWDRVWAVLRPDVDRATARPQHIRDAMHVDTAIRYGANLLVTRDKALLRRDQVVHDAFDGFRIYDPPRALSFARRMMERYEYRQAEPS